MRNFRKQFLLLFFLSFILYVTPAYANDSIWISGNVRNAKCGDTIDYNGAPKLCFEAGSSHADNVKVQIKLIGANWMYNSNGTISRGVSYTIENDNIMNLSISSVTSGFSYNDIKIPLYIRITGEGYIRCFVTTNDATLKDFSDVITTVKCDSKKVYAGSSTKKMRFSGKVAFSFIDDTKQSYLAGTKINVSINNGFHFISADQTNGTGKFENKCKFEISESDSSRGVITITENTDCKEGKIGVSGISIVKEDKELYDTAIITVKMDDSDVFTSISYSTAVAKYDSAAKDAEINTASTSEKNTAEVQTSPETTTSEQKTIKTESTTIYTTTTAETTTETTTEAATEAATETVSDNRGSIDVGEYDIVIPIGQLYYAIGDDVYNTDAAAYISRDNYTMMPVRAVANAIGVDDSKILYNSKTFTATLLVDDKTVTIVKGEKSITVDGVKQPIDTTAEIRDGRLFVPVRAMANSFGIGNENLSYDPVNRMVIIHRPQN